MRLIASGRFWMFVWLGVFGVVIVWSALTVAFWMDSVANLNALSLAAVLLACAAGVQTTLTMRKADDKDSL
jgi:hypothetical protein